MSSNTDTSPNLINNLRCFRFQKKPVLSHSGESIRQNTSTEEEENATSPRNGQPVVVVRRRIKPILDSDSDDSTPPPSSTHSSTNNKHYAEKGKQMKFLMDAFPDHDIMMLQDILLKHDWNAESAMHEILESASTRPTESRKRQGPAVKKKVKRRRIEAECDTDDSDFGGGGGGSGAGAYADNRVFDSDEDSEVELDDENLNKDKRAVLEFLQDASADELRLMPSCSQRKVDALVALRPFTGWRDLVEKVRAHRQLGSDLLNAAQRVLHTRASVRQLMHRCTALAQQMERAVAEGAGRVRSQPASLGAGLHLTNYQMVGLNWLCAMHAQGLNGILADEMGLGKTVQVIAFLTHLKEIGAARGPHLIVVPSSTLDNWRAEFERWAPGLEVFVYYGNAEERRLVRVEWARGGLLSTDVVLTTYTMVASSPEERKMFRVTHMHYVIFDEAHMLKNMNTQRYENLVRIRADSRVLLTGTPLQNNLLELMSLLIFVMPSVFAGRTDDLKSLFGKGSGVGGGAAASNKATPGTADTTTTTTGVRERPAFEREQITHAKRIMRPFVLRRLKRDVLQELPPKTDQVVRVTMVAAQRRRYNALVAHMRQARATATNTSTPLDYSGMAMMTDLRKLSNHPLLMREHYRDDVQLPEMARLLAADPLYRSNDPQRIEDDLAVMSDFELHQLTGRHRSLTKYALPNSLITDAGKLRHLDMVLPELKRSGHRVLIFSQFVVMLDVLEAYLEVRGHSFLRLDGQTPVASRQQLIDEFTADDSIFIFLLSTRAGGLGINLTAADTVIIHDIDFNPYNDKQAEDRCHRMGQTRPVSIYRLVSAGTIEEGMLQVAQDKLRLERDLTTEEGDAAAEHRSVARLLSTVLGATVASTTNSTNGDADDDDDDDEPSASR